VDIALQDQPLVTLPGVAALARVQRPVVSMWRTRLAGTAAPFPPAVVRAGRQELFRLDEVVEWLATTEHGNNADVRQEAAIFAALDAVPEAARGTLLDGLTALLAVKSVTGVQLGALTATELLDLADDADPLDAFGYREISALADDATAWARRVDDMSAAAYTPAAALDAVMGLRARQDLHEHSATTVDSRVTALAARIGVEIAGSERLSTSALAAPTGADDLVLAVGRLLGDRDRPAVTIPATTSRAARLAHRRLVAAGWSVVPAAVDAEPAWPAGTLVMAQLPSPFVPRLTDLEVVEAVEAIALGMHDDDCAVVVAPAGALVDRAGAEVVTARAAVLRTGRVRAMVRLPAGLWSSRSRQRLALWVLGSAFPDVPREDRWVTVADLGPQGLSPDALDDVVGDVVAAMGDRRSVRAHAFRFARLVPASTLVASRGDLVTPSALPAHRPRRSPAQTAAAVAALVADVNVAPPPVLVDVEHREAVPVLATTLGALVQGRAARTVPGNRIDPSHVGTGTGVPVIGVEEVLAGREIGSRTIDRLVLAGQYPASRYTEPGDVVFCATPGIGAVVDAAGYSVVQAPARILRLDRDREPRLSTEAVAHSVRTAPAGTRWQAWPVRLVPPSEAAGVSAALRAITDAADDARRRLAALDRLAATLTDAVANGVLTLTTASGDVVAARHRQEG
jgi:hypothetical protein